MDPELIEFLRRYLAGTASRRDLDALLASYDIWNAWQDGDPEIEPFRRIAGELELVSTDVGEGLRDETELRALAQRLAAFPVPQQAV